MIVAPRPDLGSRPALGYSASQLDRAAGIRSDDAALKRCCEHAQAGTYVIGGELVVLKANNELCEPLFSQFEARGKVRLAKQGRQNGGLRRGL